MALISTLPNFYNAASPASADFNNAAKAFANQLGGIYYDESGAAYTESTGNLDSSNIISFPGFRNTQKAEPSSYYSVASCPVLVDNAALDPFQWDMFAYFGPFTNPAQIVSLQMVEYDAYPTNTGETHYPNLAHAYITGGTVDVYINGAYVLSTAVNSSVSTSGPAAVANDPVVIPINMSVVLGDLVTVDPTRLTGSTGGMFFVGASLFCKSQHVR